MNTQTNQPTVKTSNIIIAILVLVLLIVSWLYYKERSNHDLSFTPLKSDEVNKIKGSQIPDSIAQIYITNYITGLPEGTIQSIWLDNTLMNYIYTHYDRDNMNGLRIYLAKYSVAGGIQEGSPQVGKVTMIAVPTNDIHGVTTAIPGAYFNYGSLCPDICPPKGTW